MMKDYHFTGMAQGRETLNFSIHIDSEDILKDKECDLIIRRVVLSALKISEKLRKQNIHINIIDVDPTTDKINYTIVEERDHPVHSISLRHFKRDHEIEKILSKQIHPTDKSKRRVGQLTLLERFSNPEEQLRNFVGRAKQALGDFFSQILYPFRQLQKLWHILTNQSSKQLQWDLNLLTEICGRIPINKMSMMHSLRYMSIMLDREHLETADPDMQRRFKSCLKFSQEIDLARQRFSKCRAQKIVNKIHKSISRLDAGTKLLIPVGYHDTTGKMMEVLLEIGRDTNGKFRVVLISAQEETRNLFDREMGITIGSQSIRREISNVDSGDLLAAIPTLVELQTSPACRKSPQTTWGDIFLQTLKFEKSQVEVGAVTEKHHGKDAPGHLEETIAYVRGEKLDQEEGKRFDLGVRLQLFLDVCKSNTKAWKDRQFWTSIRTTARYLASQIEQEKEILGPRSQQGKELASIYVEIRQLLNALDRSPPKLVNLQKQELSLASGPVTIEAEPNIPPLQAIQVKPNIYPRVDPPFAMFDAAAPLHSIQQWGKRCRNMITAGKSEAVASEAKLMVNMLPKITDPYWSTLSPEQAALLLDSFNEIGEAIARGAVKREPKSTLGDIAAITSLNFYTFEVARRANLGSDEVLANFTATAARLVNDLLTCHLSPSERIHFQYIKDNLCAISCDTMNIRSWQIIGKNFPILNLAKFTEMTLLGNRSPLATQVSTEAPIRFELSASYVTLNRGYHSYLTPLQYDVPLSLRPPEYADAVSHEITNRYLSNFCCLGCIRDNCPNYNMVDKKDHRFHPLFMLHNYVDLFCSKLTDKQLLHRDEITDLMYTQQTNQHAYNLWTSVHHSRHGFDIANGFNANDRKIQLMNTFIVYLEHPHFFRHPELRWQFETKVFNNECFSSLLENDTIDQYKPFLISALTRLKKEIAIANAVSDRETAAYLIHISDEIKELIESSSLAGEVKDALLKTLPKGTDTITEKWALEIVGRNDDHFLAQQRVVLPLVLQQYYRRFTKNCQDPCFDSDRSLELILGAVARLESNDKLAASIDPEIRDHYQSLLGMVLHKAKEKIDKETSPGDFVNKILTRFHSSVASLRLKWDPKDFPTCLALTDNGEFYQYDLSTGKLSFMNKTALELPDNIKRQSGMEKLFGAALNEEWAIRGTPPSSPEKVVAYTHRKFPNFRIIARRGPIGTDDAIGTPHIIIERSIKAHDGKDKWITYKAFETQDRLLATKELPPEPDLPVNVAIAIGDRSCWFDKHNNQILVFDWDSNAPYAIIHLNAKMNRKTKTRQISVKDVHILKDDTHLLMASDKALEQYSMIEDPNFIEVVGKKRRATQVNYQRYELSGSGAPLSYTVDKTEVTCSAFPKYRLAANGVRPGSSDPALGVKPLPDTFDGYHLLQWNGDEKVLIPMLSYAQQYSVSGNPLPSSKPVFADGLNKSTLYEYSVDPVTNRLVAKSGDAYAYLAYINMAHWDYESAVYYLSKARSSVGYNANYDPIFQWAKQWVDETPNGIAMKLHFELFQEKVLEDRRMHQIREGKLQGMEAIDIQRAPRLIHIAELYEKYVETVNSQIVSETGIDPALTLTDEQKKGVGRLIKFLLSSHGDEAVDTNEPAPTRAEQIPLQKFLEKDVATPLGINSGALSIWAFNGKDKDRTSFTLKDPQWTIQNFRDLFNQIIKEDKTSPRYKELKLQIRLQSELPKGHLSKVESTCFSEAQSYLLKLITLKETDPQGFQDLINLLGPSGKLARFNGPVFSGSRLYCIGKLDAATGNEGFDRFALRVPARAKETAQRIIDSYKAEIKKTKSFVRRTALKLFDLSEYKLMTSARRTLAWIDRWESRAQRGNFYDDFKDFLMKECLGPKGPKAIESLDEIFKFLQEVPISQPIQIMQQPPAAPVKPSITYSEKYSKLVATAPESPQMRIEQLERDIAARPEPGKSKMIETDPSKIRTVIHDGLVNKFVGYFEQKEIRPQPVNQAIFDDLAHSEEQAFVRVAEKNRDDLAAYHPSKISASISKGLALGLRKELVAEQKRISQEEDVLKRNLLQCVEYFDTPAGILAMRRLVGKGVKPSLDLLVSLWRRGETAKAWEDHPLKALGTREFSESAARQLDADIAKYLEIATVHQQLNRVVDMADSYINTCGEGSDSFGDMQLAKELFEGVQTKRNYSLNAQDNEDYRDLLYVEYTQNIIMYADQIQTLREMSFDPNAVRQLRMGRGKTEVIMPILAKRKATGKNLVVLMLPEELYEQNSRGLDIKNKLLFGQEMHRFDMGLQTDKSVEALQKIHMELLETIRDKGFIMSTKRSILGMKNSYVLLLNKLNKLEPHESRAELLAQIREMSKIMSLFYDHADVLADEVDACLDVRKEVNFALGESELVDQIKGDIGADLMHIIIDQKPGEPLYELRDALIHNTQAAISPEQRTLMLTDLVRIYYDRYQHLFTGLDKETFVQYIFNDPSGIKGQTWVFEQKQGNIDLFKQITTLKAFIDQGYGTTFGNTGNVKYGRDPFNGTYTIPYKSSNTPSINSEFDDDIERISFTYQDYLQNGVPYKQVYRMIAEMQRRALAELRSHDQDEFVNILDTTAAKEFDNFIESIDIDGKIGPGLSLASVTDPKVIATLVAAINSSPKGRLIFCHKQVVRKMTQYTSQINSMSTEAPQLVKNFGGFTGTPWNIHTYADSINAAYNLGVDGMTWHLMLGRKIDIKTFDFDAEKPIDSILTSIDVVGNYQAVIDTGAYLRGTSNDEFNDRVLEIAHKKGTPVAAGVYFDETGKIVKKQYEKKPLPIEIAPGTDLMKNFTLYDQAHTFGADIKQGKKAKAIVTIGENTFIRDLFQAVWRLRQLHQEQTVVFAVSEKIKERILGGEVRDLTIDDILKFCLKNEATREADDNYRAEKDKINGFVKRALLPEVVNLINDQAPDEAIELLAQKYFTDDAGLFIKQRPKEEAYDTYGEIKTQEPPADALARLKAKAAEQSRQVATDFKQMGQPNLAATFDKVGDGIASRPTPPINWFPSAIDSRKSEGNEVQQETQAEAELELELMVTTQTQMQNQTIKEVIIPIVNSGSAGSGDVTELVRETLDKVVSTGQVPFVNSLVQLRQFSANLEYFDPELFCSAIFERNIPVEPKMISPQCVFYSNRKPVKSVLISKCENRWTLIIPTIHEGHGICRDFVKDPPPNTKTVEVSVSAGRPFIMYKSGDDRSEALPFTDPGDEEKFYELYIQAKLFNGEIDYGTTEEENALKAWLTRNGKVAEFKRYFEENILAAKPRRFADAYAKSSLFRIFNEVLKTI